MAMDQNGNERSAVARLQSWSSPARVLGADWISVAVTPGPGASVDAPSGSCPISSGRRRCSNAFSGTSEASTAIPSSTIAARQPKRVMSNCTPGTHTNPTPMPMVAKPMAVARRPRNQWDSRATVPTKSRQTRPKPARSPYQR